jgi:hypothetical protein
MKRFLAYSLFFVIALCSHAQAPKAIPFQGVAKSMNGYVFASQNAAINFKIRTNGANGILVFEENQNVQTSNVGTFSANIGQGNILLGSLDALANSSATFFLEVNLTVNAVSYPLGVKQLCHMPHAKYANGERFRISAVGDTLFKGGNTGIIVPGISSANN